MSRGTVVEAGASSIPLSKPSTRDVTVEKSSTCYSVEDFDAIDKQNKQISNEMQKNLGNLSKRLKSLENNTMPLHNETAGLQNNLKNIETALKHVSLILGYYKVHGSYTPMMSKQPIENVGKYLSAMREIKEAEEFFSSGIAGTEVRDLKNDFARGNENLFAHFRSELHTLSVPNESLMLQLEVVNETFIKSPSQNEENNDSKCELVLLQGGLVNDLKEVSHWLCRGYSEGFDIVSSYSTARSDFFVEALKMFCDRYRTQLLLSSSSSSSKAAVDDFNFLITYQTTSLPHVPRWHQRRKNRMFRNVVVNPSLHLESVGIGGSSLFGSILGKAADGVFSVIDTGVDGVKKVGEITQDVVVGTGGMVTYIASETASAVTTQLNNAIPLSTALFGDSDEQKNSFLPDPVLEDIDMMVYVQLISAFHQLAIAEARLVMDIIPRNKQLQAFETLCKEAAKRLRSDIEKLLIVCVNRVRTIKTDLLSLRCLFPLIEFFRLKFFLSGIATGSKSSPNCWPPLSLQKEYCILYKKIMDCLKICLDAFHDNIKAENRNMPSDATVDELTVKCMTYLEYILFYRSVYSVMHANTGAMSSAIEEQVMSRENPPPVSFYQLDFNAESKTLSSHFGILCSKLTPALSKNSATEDTKDKLYIFNNLAFVIDSIDSYDISFLASYYDIRTAIDRNVQVAKMDFMSCWRKLNSNLTSKPPNIAPSELAAYFEKVKAGRADQIKMQDVERESLKNLFATFNSDFSSLHALHKTLSIPNQIYLQEIRSEIEKIVVVPYTAFFNKYEKLPFTKFRDKYIHYTPQSLIKAIDECYAQF